MREGRLISRPFAILGLQTTTTDQSSSLDGQWRWSTKLLKPKVIRKATSDTPRLAVTGTSSIRSPRKSSRHYAGYPAEVKLTRPHA